jgi:hypothetical protein
MRLQMRRDFDQINLQNKMKREQDFEHVKTVEE